MPRNHDIQKVLVIGSGPIIIGQAAEFDYAGTQACRALKEEGIEVVLINSNPATIMTDKDIADKVYIEPLTVPVVKHLIEVENQYLIRQFIVSSFRLDKIVSVFYRISRQKAAEFIRAGHVKVNHKPVEQINYLCNNRDIISFKRHGRVMFVDCQKQTRSDNHVVEGYFYK